MTIDLTFDKAEDPTRLVNLKATVNCRRGVRQARQGHHPVAEHAVHATIKTMEALEIQILGKDNCDLVAEE